MTDAIIALIGLLFSFFFSGTETAFVTVNKVRVEIWHKQGVRGAGLIKQFVTHPEKFLYTTLVGTNVANITCATFGTLFFLHTLHMSPQWTWLIMTGTILLLGEIIPKYFFRNFADSVVRKVAYPLQFFYYLLYPVILIVSFISDFWLRSFGLKTERVRDFFSRKDVEIMLKESASGEKTEEANQEILQNVLEFKNVKVRDAMIPRTDIYAIEEKSSLAQLKKLFASSGRTRIPVYREKLDNIIGVLFLKDIIKNPKSIREILHKPMFVPEYKNVDDLLREFRKTNQSIAIVVDEYGGTEGLVTLEDVLEIIIGEIQDEYDEDKNYIRRVGPDEWRIHARTEIEELNKELGIGIPEGDYDTLGGFLLNHLGHIPHKDEHFDFSHWRFVVTQATRKTVVWLRVKKVGEEAVQ